MLTLNSLLLHSAKTTVSHAACYSVTTRNVSPEGEVQDVWLSILLIYDQWYIAGLTP